MDFFIKDISGEQKEIRVALSFPEFNKFIQRAISDLGKEIKIKGFRQGRVPKEMVIKEIGQARILDEAAASAVKEIYPETVKKYNLEILGRPEIEILKLAWDNPLEFRIRVSVLPRINLPDYKKIASKAKKSEITVDDKEVERAFEQLCQIKDKIPAEQREKINFDKPSEIKEMLRYEIKRQKEMAEKGRIRNEILKEISKNCDLAIPEILIIIELQRAVEELKKNIPQMLKMSFEEYLKKLKKTQEELEESLIPEISERIKRILILKEIQKQEKIIVSDKELEAEAKSFLENFPSGKERENIDQEGLKSYIKERIEQERTLRFLENQAQ